LEVEVRERGLNDCKIFLFTDNTTAEAVYWKGTSKSEWIFLLVLRLRLLEVHNDLIIHVIHVAGTRMKAQGTDGISRGDKSMGVMRGIPVEQFYPLHETALERSPLLKSWLMATTELLIPVFLEPKACGFFKAKALGTTSRVLRLLPLMLWLSSLAKLATSVLQAFTSSLLPDYLLENGGAT
jgi:hypothetical protein